MGKTVYVNLVCGDGPFGVPDVRAHEPEAVRNFIRIATNDMRTPPVAWGYHDMEVLNPTRDESERGTDAEFENLKDAILGYYDARGLWFDTQALQDDFDLMLSLK